MKMTLQGGQAYIHDMVDMTETEDVWESSEVVEFFSGLNVLVTGGSGFIGKILVDKLLRTCSKMEKLYMFMREKKGKSAEQRFQEHFEDVLYARLKREQPDFAKKVVMIPGDTGKINLGLSERHRELLRDTHVIFHGAATVRFDEKLRKATDINVRGIKQMLLFAREMPNLKAFVHISTAFSHCVLKVIDEKFYAPPLETDKLITLVDILDDANLDQITPTLIGQFPNTYAFTKAIAEDTVKQYSTGIPTCIVRPSIVIATEKEPIAGWINNLYGATGVVVGAAVGLLRTLHCRKDNVADIIPADYVINNVIVAAWDIAKTRPKSESSTAKELEVFEPPIYNTVSSCQNPIKWGEFMKYNETYGYDVPSDKVIWYYMFMLNRHYWMHFICTIFLHFVPAAIVDTLAFVAGRKPILWSAYSKIHKFSGVISYFSTQQWRFRNDRVMQLWNKLNPTDRKLFFFNVEELDWGEYFMYHVRGLRVFLLHDPIENLANDRRKYRKLQIAHYTIMTILALLALWLLKLMLTYAWSFLWKTE